MKLKSLLLATFVCASILIALQPAHAGECTLYAGGKVNGAPYGQTYCAFYASGPTTYIGEHGPGWCIDVYRGIDPNTGYPLRVDQRCFDWGAYTGTVATLPGDYVYVYLVTYCITGSGQWGGCDNSAAAGLVRVEG